MKKIISCVIAVCMAMSLVACGGKINLDRTITMSVGLTFEVSSDWEQGAGEELPHRIESYVFTTKYGRINISAYTSTGDPIKLHAEYLSSLIESSEFTNVVEKPPVEKDIDGARLIILEYSYTHSSSGDRVFKAVYVIRGDTHVFFGYSSAKNEFNSRYFDAVIESIRWQ